jgi:hypothetical protein
LSIDKSNTALTTKYPIKNEPESPRKILAGKPLYLRKPSRQPIMAESTTSEKVSNEFRLTKNNRVNISNEIPATSPSRPSSRLKELIVPTIKNTSNITEGTIGNSSLNTLTELNFGNK